MNLYTYMGDDAPMTDSASENARRLKAIRERSGIGLRELARKIDWDPSK